MLDWSSLTAVPPLFVTFVAGLIVQQIRQQRSEEVLLINEHIDDLRQLEEHSVAYWLTEHHDEKLAVKLRASHHVCRNFAFFGKGILRSRRGKYDDLFLQITDISMGGEFESSKRKKIDPLRAEETITVTGELVHLLRLTRMELQSIRAIFYY